MKSYTFEFGNALWNADITVELPDRDAARLEASARKAPRRWLDEDPAIADIYKEIRKCTVAANVKLLDCFDGGADRSGTHFFDGRGEQADPTPEEEARTEKELGYWNILYPAELRGPGPDGKDANAAR